jgi:hypothetical protein
MQKGRSVERPYKFATIELLHSIIYHSIIYRGWETAPTERISQGGYSLTGKGENDRYYITKGD